MRGVIDVIKMGMDTVQATLQGDIKDLRCLLSISPVDLHRSLADVVIAMEQQMSGANRSSVEQVQAIRNINA